MEFIQTNVEKIFCEVFDPAELKKLSPSPRKDGDEEGYYFEKPVGYVPDRGEMDDRFHFGDGKPGDTVDMYLYKNNWRFVILTSATGTQEFLGQGCYDDCCGYSCDFYGCEDNYMTPAKFLERD